MSTSKVDINFLDVGQGSSCFVEIYDGSSGMNELTNTMLFDLGSTNNKVSAGNPSIQYIYNMLKRMRDGPVIDLLVVSHKDADHVNLLESLVNKFSKNELTIKRIYYGGRWNWYGTLFNKLKNWCKKKPSYYSFYIAASDYDPLEDKWTPTYSVNDVYVYTVMTNTPSGGPERKKRGRDEDSIVDKPSGERVNTMSAVCSVYFNGRSYIISGDATYTTICEVNRVFQGHVFNYVQAMTLPHHGSRKTTFGLKATNANISSQQLKSVKTFAGIFNGKTLIASADTQHCHPSLEVMELFYEYTDKGKTWYFDPDLKAVYGNDWHYVTAYIDLDITYPDKSLIPMSNPPYESFPSAVNIYSTLYCDDKALFSFPPADKLPKKKKPKKFPKGVSWYYRDDRSALTLDKFDNRDGMSVEVKKELDGKAPEVKADEPTRLPASARGVTRMISAPAAGAGTPAFSRRFGRRVL